MFGLHHAKLDPKKISAHAFRHINAFFFCCRACYTKQYYILTKACDI